MLAASACGDGDDDQESTDAGATYDAARDDASAGDASAGDAAVPDAALRDAAAPDAPPSDAAPPDARVPDAAPPDASAPDATPPDAGPSPGLIGSRCESSDDCSYPSDWCIRGFCTATCGSGGAIANCNHPALADPDGVWGGRYACWWLGEGLVSLCWPNGSGADCSMSGTCPRADETCTDGLCGYTGRSELRCYRDGDCMEGESCTLFSQLDFYDDVRAEGACLWNGDGASARAAAGASCTGVADCGSMVCDDGQCMPMCVDAADCPSASVCAAVGMGDANTLLAEYDSQWAGMCKARAGSGDACSSNDECPALEVCEPVTVFTAYYVDVTPAGACATVFDADGLSTGSPCTADVECMSGRCLTNGLTGLGYCTSVCGDDLDCAGSTECRALVYDAHDPRMDSDDLRWGSCVLTDVGQPCLAHPACKVCTDDTDCAPAQGVDCIRRLGGDPTGHCMDLFGRCADPCRSCGAVGGDCPGGATCNSVMVDFSTTATYCDDGAGGCLRADLDTTLRYEHGMCGDAEFPLGGGGAAPQQDLCYFAGSFDTPTFACGARCDELTSCPAIPTTGADLPTECRTVYTFGDDTYPGKPRSAQCAPADAYAP